MYQSKERHVSEELNQFTPVEARQRGRLVLIVAAPSFKMLDVSALLDAFSQANRTAGGDSGYDVRIISASPNRDVTSRDGVVLQAAMAFGECFDIADTLLVAGFHDGFKTEENELLLKWLRWQASQTRRMGAVSNGALMLAEAGLLNGRRATTHWQDHETLSTRYPGVSIERDVLYVRDANLYTCAGATAGLDLALSMIEADLGPGISTAVAESMLLYLRRSGNAPQISRALQAQAVPANPITDLLTWLPGNLGRDLSVKTLARRSAMSPRNFARVFARQVGLTPAKHIENLRLEAAQYQLESTQLTIHEVAFSTGYENSETLRRLFIRRLGVTPGRYRAIKDDLERGRNVEPSNSGVRAPGKRVVSISDVPIGAMMRVQYR